LLLGLRLPSGPLHPDILLVAVPAEGGAGAQSDGVPLVRPHIRPLVESPVMAKKGRKRKQRRKKKANHGKRPNAGK
jgi:hypothetical protein